MSDFASYTKRLEAVGIRSLWISLGADAEGYRLMHVSPDSSNDRAVASRFPTRTFRIDGSDPVFDAIVDDLAYEDDLEKQRATLLDAINRHPHLRDDLNGWYAQWLLMNRADEADINAEPVDEAMVERSMQYVKGMLRGLDSLRKREAKSVPKEST